MNMIRTTLHVLPVPLCLTTTPSRWWRNSRPAARPPASTPSTSGETSQGRTQSLTTKAAWFSSLAGSITTSSCAREACTARWGGARTFLTMEVVVAVVLRTGGWRSWEKPACFQAKVRVVQNCQGLLTVFDSTCTGRVRRSSKSNGPGRVGSGVLQNLTNRALFGDPTRPDP